MTLYSRFERLRYYAGAYLKLRRTFSNWLQISSAHLRKAPVDVARLRTGNRLEHPPAKRGMADTVVEIWGLGAYETGARYRPQPGDVIVDAGANVGLFSVWMLQQEPACRLIAVEPVPENLEYLHRNLAAYQRQVTIVPAALSSERGVGHIETGSERSIDHKLGPGGVAVALETLGGVLDTRMPADQHVALLKMDIEGAEAAVLEQTSEALLRRIEHMFIEFHDNVVPGTLDRLKRRLDASHRVEVVEQSGAGYGVLWCQLRTLPG